MPISKKRRSEDTLFGDQPMAQVFPDVDGEDNPIKEADRVAELEQALKDLRDQREADREMDALRGSGPTFQSQVTPTYQEVDPNSIELPDPALDPQGYDAAVGKRTEIRMDNKTKKDDFERKQAEDIKNKVNSLWTNFEDQYPEYVGDATLKERTEIAANFVIKAAVAKGVDAQKYMFGTQNRFLKDVAKKYDEIFGAPEALDDGYEDDLPARSRTARASAARNSSRRQRTEDDDVARTGGIFGGDAGSGRRSKPKDEDENGPGDMIADIQKLQRSSGFF